MDDRAARLGATPVFDSVRQWLHEQSVPAAEEEHDSGHVCDDSCEGGSHGDS